MKPTRQDYREFLNENFQGLRLGKYLFGSWKNGLRFDLQLGDTDTEEYFEEVTKRASSIFKTSFDDSDTVFIIFMDYKYRRRKIRFSNFIFKQIADLTKTEVSYATEKHIYDLHDKLDIRNIAIIKICANRIDSKSIFTAIANTDFQPREPRLDQHQFFTAKEVYFVNIDKKIIFNMYDDRGLDIIAADQQTLYTIYQKHNDWILDYDRETIDKQFA